MKSSNYIRHLFTMQGQMREVLLRTLAALETPGDLTKEEKRHLIEDAGSVIERTPNSEWLKTVMGCEVLPPQTLVRVPKLIGTGHGWLVHGVTTPEESDGFLNFQEVYEDGSFGEVSLALSFRLVVADPNVAPTGNVYDMAEVIVDFAEAILDLKGIDDALIPYSVHFNFREDTKGRPEIQALMNDLALSDSKNGDILVVDLAVQHNPDLRL